MQGQRLLDLPRSVDGRNDADRVLRWLRTVPIPKELPVELPLDLKPTGAGNPLAEREDSRQRHLPRSSGPAKRATNTLDCRFETLAVRSLACVSARTESTG